MNFPGITICAALAILPAVVTAAPQATRWENAARQLEAQNLRYAQRWVPPGESQPWVMDCSNAVRWMAREVLGRNLPRTASAQYETLRRERKFRRMKPADRRLPRVLRPGDLLFWEHSYRPARKPPVTHVMVYLGRDARGRMRMAGAQGSRGVGIYEFRPEQVIGGYRWFLWFRRDSRFIGFARL